MIIVMKRSLFALSLLSILLFASFLPSEAFSGRSARMKEAFVEGEALVRFAPALSGASAQYVASSAGMSVAASFGALSEASGRQYLHLRSDSKSTREMIDELSKTPGVEVVEPNFIRSVRSTPDDPRFVEQWALRNSGQTGGTPGADIGATEAWAIRTDASGAVVAVLDTGVYYAHEDLAANMWDGSALGFPNHGWNFADDSDDPYDMFIHGTHCAGMIAAVGNNALGTAGAAWNARIMAVKILDDEGMGTSAMALAGYDWVLARKKHGVNVVAINASFGGSDPSDLEREAIAALGDAGVLFIAAAGNNNADNDRIPFYPASYNLPNIISVAASDHNDARASFSNFGATSVHIAAPGVDIVSTLPHFRPVGPAFFFDDMENGDAKWREGRWNASAREFVPDAGTSWALAADAAFSPVHSWTSSPPSAKGSYHGIATYVDIDLTSVAETHCALNMRAMYSISEGNWMDIYYSKDGGATWSYMGGKGAADSEGEWEELSFYIPPSFRTNTFRFGIGLEIASDAPGDFVRIDDVRASAIETDSAYGKMSGTSMAAPHVAGAAALLAAAYPSESVEQRRERILHTVDRLEAWNGAVSTSGRLNLAKAVRRSFGGSGCSVGGAYPFALLLAAPFLFLRKK